ncbi:MAG: phytanoyl-CoA dioxygenase family protein [Cellvibrionaceae bacterium]
MNSDDFSLDMAKVTEGNLSDKIDKATHLFQKNGFIRLENIFEPSFIKSITDFYNKNYLYSIKNSNAKDKRPLHTLTIDGPLNSPEYYANPKVTPLLKNLLGDNYIIGSFSGVLSFPGAPDQRIHRDSEPLYNTQDNYEIDVKLPAHSVTFLVPLVDCNKQTGCTRVWPGSHLISTNEAAKEIEAFDPEVSVGSILLTDSRVIHHGAANKSDIHRPLLYITYHRHWFRDYWGYEHRPPIHINTKQLNIVPKEYQHLFSWTKNPYKRWEFKQAFFKLLPSAILNKFNIIKGR